MQAGQPARTGQPAEAWGKLWASETYMPLPKPALAAFQTLLNRASLGPANLHFDDLCFTVQPLSQEK